MVKLDWRPTSSAWLRSIRAATEWKVPSHGMPSIAPPEIAETRSLHLARGLVGEGDGEDLARPGQPGGDEVGEPGGQRRGLAGARAGEHQHRPFGRQHGLALRRVEARAGRRARGSGLEIQALGGGRRGGVHGNRIARGWSNRFECGTATPREQKEIDDAEGSVPLRRGAATKCRPRPCTRRSAIAATAGAMRARRWSPGGWSARTS